jgi:integrase
MLMGAWVRRRKDRKGSPSEWVCDFDDRDGKRRRQSFATKAEAEEYRARKILELGQAGPLLPTADLQVTVAEYSEQWLASCVGLKQNTLRSYRESLDNHILPALGRLKVREVRPRHLLEFLRGLLADGAHKASTVRTIYAPIRSLLSRAVVDELVQTNASIGLWRQLPLSTRQKYATKRRSRDDLKAMTREEVDAFLTSAAKNPRYYVVFLTLAKSGIRGGEALGLELDDVDVRRREIHIRQSLARTRAGLSLEDRLDSPKSGKLRTVEIGKVLTEELRRHIVRRRAENLRRGAGERSPWLFAAPEGGPLDETRVRKAFRQVLKDAGLSLRFTPHSLRHTYASQMLGEGASLTWVAAQLGHSSPQITLDNYAWALPSTDRAYADLLDAPRVPVAAAVGSVTNGDQGGPNPAEALDSKQGDELLPASNL